MSRNPSLAFASGVTMLLAAAWAVFYLALHAGGHAPSGPLFVPIARERYYLYEAVLSLPVKAVAVAMATLVAQGVARVLGGAGVVRATAVTTALALTVPSLLAWLLPDAVVVALGGFDMMAKAMRFYVPLSIAWTLGLLALAVRAVHGLSMARAIVVAITAFVAYAACIAPFLR